jgi:protein O-mannosyl-transferase
MTMRDLKALCLALFCIAATTSARFANDLVYDDIQVINGPLIHHPERLPEVFASHAMLAQGDQTTRSFDTYRPVSIASFFWDAWISGKDPWSYHLTNLLLHLGATACLFTLARLMLPTAGTLTMLFGALFFGLSPHLAEGHIWINGRSDPLTTLFGLAALIAWRHALASDQSRNARLLHAASALSFLLGLLSKEVLLLTTPAILLWPEHKPQPLLARIRRTIGFAAASVIYLALRLWVLGGLRVSPAVTKVASPWANLPVLWLDGLTELLMPTHLYLRSMRNEYVGISSLQRWLIVLTLVTLCVGLGLIRRRAPVLAWSFVWFLLTLAPAAAISTMVWPGFGRYLYLPCAGLTIGLCETIVIGGAWARRSRASAEYTRIQRAFRFVLGLYLASFAVQLWATTADYRDNTTLYLAAIRGAPRSAHGYGWLGMWHFEAKRYPESVPLLEKAVALDPSQWRYLERLISSYLFLSKHKEAEAAARAGLTRSGPAQAGELRILLVWSLADRDPPGAVRELCKCLHYQPDFPKCTNAVGRLLDPQGKLVVEYRKAFAQFEQTCPFKEARDVVQRILPALVGAQN